MLNIQVAKDNYTMLDNLKLGYGGTQSEMARLINDSGVLGDAIEVTAETVKDVPFDKIIEAIHKTQEELGIAGATADEAEGTISGSFSALKSAWSNTLTALSVGGDMLDTCIDNLVDSALTFVKNVRKPLKKALEGVGTLITELAPVIEKELPGLIDTLLPPLIKAATSLVKGLIVALPDIVSAIAKELPNVLSQLWAGVKEAFGDIPGMKKMDGFFGKLNTGLTENSGIIKKIIPGIIGLVAAFKLFNKIKGITSLFGGGGGGAGGGFFSGLASMKPTVALKGLANLAIIIGGLGLLAAAVMAAAPYMAKLSDLKSVGEVLVVISAVGLVGTAMTKLAGMVGNIPVATVDKGIANIAVVMISMGALTAALMWVAPYINKLSDMGSIMKLLAVMGAVGLVGTGLTVLAGFVGGIPTGIVLTGLANIALALGGFTAVVAAFGALNKIDGFSDFINSGGEILADLCRILGEMAGSLIGGLGEGITNSLPKIGENLSAFATSLQPMFDTFAGVDASGLSDFAGALAAFIGVIAGEKIVSVITGGIDYADLGNKLNTMASSLSGFFTTIMTFPDGGFEKATALFNCLANISSLPKEGGVVGWFQGEVNFGTMAAGLNQLAGTVGFFTAIQAIPEEAFTKAGQLFDCLAGIKSLPKDGGVVGWFQGEVNFATIASGIQTLASGGMITALTTLSALPENAFTSLTQLFDALAGIKAMPKEGGIAGWFAGEESTGLTNIASQLPGVASSIASFFANLGGITDFSPIKNLFDTLSNIEISSDAAEGTGLFGLGASALETMGTGLSNFAENAAGFFSAINGLDTGKLKTFFAELTTAGELPTALASLDGSVGTALSTMVTTIETKMTEAKNAITTGVTGCISVLTASAPAFYNSGVAMMQGLNNGLNSMRGTLMATAASIASSIASTMNAALQINSPSKITTQTGIDTGMGVVVGMKKMIPTAQSTAVDLAQASIPYADSYSPESSVTTYNSGGNSEYTSIAPVFNLTITGSQDDRSLARKVKRYVSEGISEVFESFERKTYVTREA